MNDVVSYKCINCGAPLSFDIQKQNWDCKFCMSEFSLSQLEQEGEKETAREGGFTPPHAAYDNDATAYTCPSCGGKIITDKNTAATFCVYCHNPTVIASRLTDEHKPTRVLPFQLEKQEVVEAMNKLLRRRPLLPADFRDIAKKGEISGLYVPFWLFSAEVDAYLAAQGFRVSTWSDHNYRYTKTDTYHVERAAEISFRELPADGSAKMDDRLMQALEPFDYRQMQDFSMGYLSGHFAESYDVDAKEASAQAFSRMDEGVARMMRELVGGYTSYNITAQSNTRKNTDCMYVMLPVWVLMADYKGKRYTFAMNGQTGKMVGRLPMSWKRVLAWFGCIAAVVSAVVFGGGMLL